MEWIIDLGSDIESLCKVDWGFIYKGNEGWNNI